MLIFCFLFFLQQGTRGNFFDLMSPEYRRTSLQMWLMWFVTAFSYYGMVLASAEILQIHNSGENSKGRSPLAIYLPWTLNEHLSSTYALCTRYMPKTTVLLQLSSHYIVLIFTLYLLCMNLNIADAESCKCNLLKPDDYITMLLSTFGEFIGIYYGHPNLYTCTIIYTICSVILHNIFINLTNMNFTIL